jgi:hypothetical protein
LAPFCGEMKYTIAPAGEAVRGNAAGAGVAF